MTSNDCCICLDPLTDKVTMQLECNHIIHTTCGLSWILSGKNSCPLCRSKVQVQSIPERPEIPAIPARRVFFGCGIRLHRL